MINFVKGWNWYTRKKAIYILLICGVLSVFFVSLLPKLKMDYQFKRFFPSESKDTKFFETYQSVFKTDNDFLLVTFSPDKGVFNLKTLKNAEKCIGKIEKLKDVNGTRSIFSEEYSLLVGSRVQKQPVLNWELKDFEKDSLRLMQHPEFVSALISDDGKSLGILVDHRKGLNPKTGKSLLEQLEVIQSQHPQLNMQISGRIVGERFYIEKMSQELFLFIGISVFLVIVFLLITFKSFWGVVLPSILLFLVTVWVFGILVLTDRPVNVLLVMLPSILFVVTMSDVIHIYSFYLEKIREGLSRHQAVKEMTKDIGLATFLTSFTTAIGFFTLMFIPVQPIQVFGFFTGIGVIIAFLLTIFVLSALLYVSPIPKVIQTGSKRNWGPMLDKLFQAILRKKRVILIGSLLISIVGLFGINKVKSNAYLMDNVRSEEPIKVQFDFIDQHFGGVRPFELGLIPKEGVNLKNLDFVREVAAIEDYLNKTHHVKILRGLGLFSKVGNRIVHADNPKYYAVPEPRDWRNVRRAILTAENGNVLASISDSTGKLFRISGLSRDWGSNYTEKLTKDLNKWHKGKYGNESLLTMEMTGSAYMYDLNMDQLSETIFIGIIVSVLSIALIVGLLFQSLKMAVISVIPNIIPLLGLVLVMWFFHIELKLSTAIVFTIAFGIAVDDTIHFLSRFKIEIERQQTVLQALRVSFLGTGKAMILTTVLLCVGFLSMIFSSFLGTFYMGLMVSITLAIALVADLTILPILLLLFYKKKTK